MDCVIITNYLERITRLNNQIGDLGDDFEADIAQTSRDSIDTIIWQLTDLLEIYDERYATLEQVEKLFGDKFIGPDTVDGFLGKELFIREKTRLPEFLRFTLMRARYEGAFLIWRRQKDSHDKAISKIADLEKSLRQAAEWRGLTLEIQNSDLVKFVSFMMAEGWAIVYNQGSGRSYYEEYLDHDKFLEEKQADTRSLKERLHFYRENKQKIAELIKSKAEVDEIKNALDSDQIDGVMRPSVIELFYDLIAILTKTGSVPIGEFWTSTMLPECKMATIKTEMIENKLTVTFGERDITEKGPISLINRIDIFEKFNELLERDRRGRGA